MLEPMPDTLPELLELVQKRAKAKTIQGPDANYNAQFYDGVDRILNPAFRDLLALLEEECNPDSFDHQNGTCECEGSGFVLRTAYWQAALMGAMVVPLLIAVPGMVHLEVDYSHDWREEHPEAIFQMRVVSFSTDYRDIVLYGNDLNVAVLQAVARYLEAKL